MTKKFKRRLGSILVSLILISTTTSVVGAVDYDTFITGDYTIHVPPTPTPEPTPTATQQETNKANQDDSSNYSSDDSSYAQLTLPQTTTTKSASANAHVIKQGGTTTNNPTTSNSTATAASNLSISKADIDKLVSTGKSYTNQVTLKDHGVNFDIEISATELKKAQGDINKSIDFSTSIISLINQNLTNMGKDGKSKTVSDLDKLGTIWSSLEVKAGQSVLNVTLTFSLVNDYSGNKATLSVVMGDGKTSVKTK